LDRVGWPSDTAALDWNDECADERYQLSGKIN
jgi:hypothetical protein